MDKIQKTICREELKSRICGLFAYLEENDAGEFKLHRATDSLNGCYGKIIENMVVGASLTVENETIIQGGNVYSYRTVMNNYYQYKYDKDVVISNKLFFDFVDEAIGKTEIDFNELGLNENDNDLVPHFIYLANVRSLINQYSKMKTVYDYYTGGNESFDINSLESDVCCLCSKYRRMGGNKMYDKLNELMSVADEIADKYYGYACKNTGTLTLNLNVALKQSIHDIGYLSCYLNKWVGGDEHFKGELYTHNGNTYVCMNDNTDEYNDTTMRFEFDSTKFQLISQVKKSESEGEDYQLKGSADSKLRSLRRFKTYMNLEDKEETTSSNEDWLYYYRVGLVTGYKTVTDDLGNIVNVKKLEQGIVEAATENEKDKLAAYGNVITSITAKKEEHTITFTYKLNAHLTSEDVEVVTDDDGNKIYKFTDFIIDRSDQQYHGVEYTETYTYEEGGELDELVNAPTEELITFDKYIKDIDGKCITFKKYAFKTNDSINYYDKSLDTAIVSIPYIKTDYEAIVKNETDYLFADVFKTDYLSGITYKPIVENDVRIDRGNYSAFERHLKLSEVKSMEDMENYSNNSFFNVRKTN